MVQILKFNPVDLSGIQNSQLREQAAVPNSQYMRSQASFLNGFMKEAICNPFLNYFIVILGCITLILKLFMCVVFFEITYALFVETALHAKIFIALQFIVCSTLLHCLKKAINYLNFHRHFSG